MIFPKPVSTKSRGTLWFFLWHFSMYWWYKFIAWNRCIYVSRCTYCHLDETRIALSDLFVTVVLLPLLATCISPWLLKALNFNVLMRRQLKDLCLRPTPPTVTTTVYLIYLLVLLLCVPSCCETSVRWHWKLAQKFDLDCFEKEKNTHQIKPFSCTYGGEKPCLTCLLAGFGDFRWYVLQTFDYQYYWYFQYF